MQCLINHIDGPEPSVDAKYLSVGIAQYNKEEVSTKCLRHSGNRWSPQSEELPLHRVIYMCLFLAKALFDSQDGKFIIEDGLFSNQLNCISISQEQRTKIELANFESFIKNNEQKLKERLNILANLLDSLQKQGKI